MRTLFVFLIFINVFIFIYQMDNPRSLIKQVKIQDKQLPRTPAKVSEDVVEIAEIQEIPQIINDHKNEEDISEDSFKRYTLSDRESSENYSEIQQICQEMDCLILERKNYNEYDFKLYDLSLDMKINNIRSQYYKEQYEYTERLAFASTEREREEMTLRFNEISEKILNEMNETMSQRFDEWDGTKPSCNQRRRCLILID